MLEATGERLVPDRQKGELVVAEHLVRYRLAALLAPGKRVLDVACGEGYGTAMLAEAGAAETTGADVAPEAVEHAGHRYPGARFVAGDISSLPFGDGEFDLVVSFETIEHVPEPERALDELRRVLAPHGLLVISTPNKREYRVENEFHLREFTHDEFAAVLGQRFDSVAMLYQQNWLATTVSDEDVLKADDGSTRLDLTTVKVDGRPPGRELYTVAICGRDAATALERIRPQAVLSGVYEAHEMAERLVDAERTAQKWHDEYKSAERTAQKWHSDFEDARKVAEQWHDAAEQWEREADRRAAVIAEMEASASWRLTRPLRAAKSRGKRER